MTCLIANCVAAAVLPMTAAAQCPLKCRYARHRARSRSMPSRRPASAVSTFRPACRSGSKSWSSPSTTTRLADHHAEVLDPLGHECVQATFFLLGRNAEARATVARRELADGHSVGYQNCGLRRRRLGGAMHRACRAGGWPSRAQSKLESICPRPFRRCPKTRQKRRSAFTPVNFRLMFARVR